MMTRPQPARILLVDPAPERRRRLRLELSDTPWEILEAGTVLEAVAVIEHEAIDVVLAEEDLPGLHGSDFLGHVRRVRPQAVRLLTCDEPTLDMALRAINGAQVTRLLARPFGRDGLRRAIEEGLAQRVDAREGAAAPSEATDPEHPDSGHEDLDRALGSLWLAVQPIVSSTTHSIFGYEALLRSDEPRLETPGQLFALAHRLGRSLELSRRCRLEAAGIFPRVPEDVHLFVNLNPEDLEDFELLGGQDPLTEFAQRVVLEVTERESLSSEERLQARIETLRGLGYKTAIDDLGAGYSSLNSFALLQPDFAKFDMSLMRDIDCSPTKRRVVEHMVDLCRDLDIRTIAEGIETESELGTCRELGCAYLQGYHLARPVRAWDARKSHVA